MKNFLSIENIKTPSSINSFITASSAVNRCAVINLIQEDKNIWLSEEYLPQEIILNFRTIKLKEYPKKLAGIGIYCWKKYPTNPKIIEVLISREKNENFISLGHFDLSYKAGRQLIYLDDESDLEISNILNIIKFENLIIKLIIKETFGGTHTYINNLYLYDCIDTNSINNNTFSSNALSNNNLNNNEYEKSKNENINKPSSKKTNKKNIIIIENNLINNTKNDNKSFTSDNNDSKKTNKTLNSKQSNKRQKKVTKKSKDNSETPNEKISPQITEINQRNKKILISQRSNEKLPINLSNNTSIKSNSINKNNNKKSNTKTHENSHYFSNSNSSAHKLSQLINQFKTFKENQETIIKNYDNRLKNLEQNFIEMKTNMKKMNATMNTIIDSQYNQSQKYNDYYLKECQNMINESIVGVLSNLGKYKTQNQQIYNQSFPIKNNSNNNILINNNENYPEMMEGNENNNEEFFDDENNKNNELKIINSNGIYNDDHIPYEEGIIRNYPEKFSKQNNNEYLQIQNENNSNNINELYEMNNMNSESNTMSYLTGVNKIRDNKIYYTQGHNEEYEQTQNYITIPKNFQKKVNKNRLKTPINKVNLPSEMNINKENSEDENMSDDTEPKAYENLLKPSLEKFENYMNSNNFTKSQNNYQIAGKNNNNNFYN